MDNGVTEDSQSVGYVQRAAGYATVKARPSQYASLTLAPKTKQKSAGLAWRVGKGVTEKKPKCGACTKHRRICQGGTKLYPTSGGKNRGKGCPRGKSRGEGAWRNKTRNGQRYVEYDSDSSEDDIKEELDEGEQDDQDSEDGTEDGRDEDYFDDLKESTEEEGEKSYAEDDLDHDDDFNLGDQSEANAPKREQISDKERELLK